MNWTVAAAFALFAAGAALFLGQLWFVLLAPETFLKAMITLGVALGLVLAWNLVQRERRDAAALRDKTRLD